jgi:hypothetical protein
MAFCIRVFCLALAAVVAGGQPGLAQTRDHRAFSPYLSSPNTYYRSYGRAYGYRPSYADHLPDRNGYSPFGGIEQADAFGMTGGTYRTLCVRLCDGYYFPLSHAAPMSLLSRDADKCTAACGEEGRLFYHPTQTNDVSSALDFTGSAYSGLANAFRYRKALVDGCTCKPQSHLQAERASHAADTHTAQADREPLQHETPSPMEIQRLGETGAVSRPAPVIRDTWGQWPSTGGDPWRPSRSRYQPPSGDGER